MTSPNTFLMAWKLLLTCALLQVTSAYQCDRDVTSIQRAYCSSVFSFQGTVVSVAGSEIRSTSSNDADGLETDRHASGTVEYDVSIEEIFKGLNQEYLGRNVTVFADNNAARGYSKLQRGVTYLFEVDNHQYLDICDRVDQLSDIAEGVRQDLRYEYAFSCSSINDNEQQASERNEEQNDGWRISGEQMKPLLRGNFPARNPIKKRPGRYKWNPECKCKVLSSKKVTKKTPNEKLDQEIPLS